ncbi:hypothetical protein LXL04_013748 [Taraxacum kok-saghyz]
MMQRTKQFQHLKIQLEVIKSATNNFADDKCIGRGGFGKVYKGELLRSEGNIVVAIKRLDPRFGQGNPEFWKEIVILSLYKHENIISLLGFCDESNEKILVYEYASRKSLDLYLNNANLSWIQRLKICIGVARGLAYLHNPGVSQQRVLHRDIKTSNILLDENWNPKISDLGLSKFGPANQQHTFCISNVVGTIGYCDPLYIETGLLTKESDVYSFGVVLFEVLCGRLCISNKKGTDESLTSLVRQYYQLNKISEIIYGNIGHGMNPESLELFTTIGYQCLNRDLKERPLMSDVVNTLESALEYQVFKYQVHSLMCAQLMKPVDSVIEIFEEIQASRPRCKSGIEALCTLYVALDKAKSLVQYCSESSKLYLAFIGSKILSRCKNVKTLLKQSLSRLQNMVNLMLASKISMIITELERVEISLDPSEEEAGKSVKGILEGYRMGNSSQNENVYECIRIIALKLQLTSSTALVIEQRSIKKLLNQLREEENKQQKKQILTILLNVLKNHGNLFTSVNVDNDSIVQNQDYGSQRVDYFVDHDEASKGIMFKEFMCPLSLKNTCELDIELSQELDDTLPWEFQCKFIENLKIRLKDDHRACKLMPSENFLESIIRFLKAARNKNDIKPQRMGCLLLLGLVTKCRCIKNSSNAAYELISEFLESDLKEEAPAIIEN